MMLSRRSVLGSLMAVTTGGTVTSPGYGLPRVVRGLGHPTQFGISDGNPTAERINPYLPGTGWDVIFHTDTLAIPEVEFECYHIALDGPIGSSCAILIDRFPWDFVNQGWSNGWDPSQPMLLRAGVSVQFCWNTAFTSPPYNRTTNIQPVVTLWLRSPPVDILAS